MSDSQEQKDNPYFQHWYEKNKESISQRRKDSYASDPEYREKLRQKSKDYRERRARGEQVQTKRYATVKGKRVRVYTTGHIADRYGVSSEYVRRLQVVGKVPPPTIPGKHRLYTGHQMMMIGKVLNKKCKKITSW